MWILLILVALGFIIGSGLILLRTAKTPLPHINSQPKQDNHD
jgi:hypothetical protein